MTLPVLAPSPSRPTRSVPPPLERETQQPSVKRHPEPARPRRSRRLVGRGHGDQLNAPARQRSLQLGIFRCAAVAGPTHHDARAVEEQAAVCPLAGFRNRAEPFLPSAQSLHRHEPGGDAPTCPPAWVPAATHLRELREPVRRCEAVKAARVEQLNCQKAGFAAPAVARPTTGHIHWLDQQIEAVMDEVRHVISADLALSTNLTLHRSITSLGEVSAIILLAELPNIAELTPKALAAFVGLLPSKHSSGASVRRPGKSATLERSACAPGSTCVL